MLGVGDISENQPGIKRKMILESLYSVYPNDEGRQVAEEMINARKLEVVNAGDKDMPKYHRV